MPKEWTGPSEYFAAGLYGGQSRKAIFRSVLAPEGHTRGFNAMEFEEAADLSLKKSKPTSYENREKVYPSPYTLDETMDLSTKWRPTTERKPSSLAQPSNSLDSHPSERKRSSSSKHHSRMLPRKRLHAEQRLLSSEPLRNSNCPSPDIIVLSDEDKGARLNGHATNGYSEPHSEDSAEPMELPPLPQEKQWDVGELRLKRRLLREIRDELRSEEMKLVLLKKLHQSQLVKENLLSQAAAVASKIVPSANNRGVAAPPPLVRSGQIQSQPPQNKMLTQQLSSHQSSMMNTPLMQTTHGGPPPLIGQRGSSGGSSSNMIGSLMRSSHSSRAPVTTPPNMVMGYNLHNMQQSLQSNQHQISMNQATHPQACPSPSALQDSQTPAQRQAAAKLALRKQLEKTLLQIPPPKPPPPEMHFVPNANNQEFICLLGLEKVVDLITDDPSVSRPPPDPFECVQCGTDFSPVWKWQDAGRRQSGKPSVICETCVTSNIKKALKAEHTNRLKTAFVKALQQEQEIEQRMAQPPSPTPTPPSPVPTPPAAPHSPKMNSASLLQHLPKLSAAHQSLLHAQAQQLQHFAAAQTQPQPAHMYPFGPLLAAQAYSYQLLGGKSPAELQRQYLLDMIPPRSLPQGNWKT